MWVSMPPMKGWQRAATIRMRIVPPAPDRYPPSSRVWRESRSWSPKSNQRDWGKHSLAQDGLEDPPAVRNGAQIALAADARSLETRHLDDLEPVLQGPYVVKSLDLEPVAVAVERGRVPGPERHVAVAEIGEEAAIEHPHDQGQAPVAEHPEQRHVVGPGTLEEARALGHIRAGH